MRFDDALTELYNGNRVQRSGWNGKGMYIFTDNFGVDILSIRATDGYSYPWTPSQQDIFAEDWVVYRS